MVPLGIVLCVQEVACLLPVLSVGIHTHCKFKHPGFDVKTFSDRVVLEIVVEIGHHSGLCCLYSVGPPVDGGRLPSGTVLQQSKSDVRKLTLQPLGSFWRLMRHSSLKDPWVGCLPQVAS